MAWEEGQRRTPRFRLRLPDFDEDLVLGWRRLRSWDSVQKACRERFDQPSNWEPASGCQWRMILSELLFEICLGLWFRSFPAPGVAIKRGKP